jgi:hypothetical protein
LLQQDLFNNINERNVKVSIHNNFARLLENIIEKTMEIVLYIVADKEDL